ncbi:MAG: hypothetical protein KAR20_07960 [Candidatus Heimdallarchaeota archaeon]|nr:hypothetical protein [Candidatus Heimdallarchaeota archaeon]
MTYLDILNRYEELVGMYQELFQETAIQRAEKIFGKDKDTATKALEELVETVSWLIPREIPHFLQRVISDETFKYQKDSKKILRGRHKQVKDFVFHINAAKLLYSTNGELTPRYILDGNEFDPEDEDDYCRVCFAQGSLGDLSVYLAGHIFCDPDNEVDTNEKRFDPNNPFFPHKYKIAVVKKSFTKHSGPHSIETRYFGTPRSDFTISELDDPENCISVEQSDQKTPLVTILSIPYTIWTKDQIQACEKEARMYRENRVKNIDREFGYVPQDQDAYVRLFVAERKFEHEVLYALHKFITQTSSSKSEKS